MEVTFYFEADAQCAPLRCLHKFLYVGAAIGRPFGIKVTFILKREDDILPYGYELTKYTSQTRRDRPPGRSVWNGSYICFEADAHSAPLRCEIAFSSGEGGTK